MRREGWKLLAGGDQRAAFYNPRTPMTEARPSASRCPMWAWNRPACRQRQSSMFPPPVIRRKASFHGRRETNRSRRKPAFQKTTPPLRGASRPGAGRGSGGPLPSKAHDFARPLLSEAEAAAASESRFAGNFSPIAASWIKAASTLPAKAPARRSPCPVPLGIASHSECPSSGRCPGCGSGIAG